MAAASSSTDAGRQDNHEEDLIDSINSIGDLEDRIPDLMDHLAMEGQVQGSHHRRCSQTPAGYWAFLFAAWLHPL